MKAFKKKTLALVLASVVSIAGSFATEHYKNSLLGIDFLRSDNGSGALSMVVQTKTKYNGNVSPMKQGANTYVLMLPEVDSKMTVPDITKYRGFVQNISIRTMPYTNTGKGYTKITVTTNNVPSLLGQNQVYIPSVDNTSRQLPDSRGDSSETYNNYQSHEEASYDEQRSSAQSSDYRYQQMKNDKTEENAYQEDSDILEEKSLEQEAKVEVSNDIPDVTYPMAKKDSTEAFMLILGILLIFAVTIYSYVKAKERLRELAGENLEIDITEEDSKSKKSKKSSSIKNTIKTLDSAYSKTAVPRKNYSKPVAKPEKKIIEEEINVVDLDELFKEKVNSSVEKKQTEEEENLALEEFLSGFSFDENLVPVLENSAGYDIEFYEQLMNNKKIFFTADDVECINKLLTAEIEDSTLQHIEEYLVSNPIKKRPTRREILEDLVTTYTISQNVTFSHEDVRALYKLISVEFDQDFITDLKTNPERTEKMRKEIESFNSEYKKPSETKVLMVSELLPDLSEAVKKQAGKKIQSEVKAETVYFSEGYDVSKLKVDLPDISKELENASAYVSKPSATYEIVDNSYEVQKLKITSELPDLQDALANPEKYEQQVEEVVVDEKALLKNISNVQFKPFYEGQEYEVLNNFDDVPSVDDVQNEMNQFDNFEIVEEKIQVEQAQEEYDDFEALYNNEYVDLDNPEESTFKEPEVNVTKFSEVESVILERQIQKPAKRERASISEDLLNKIAQRRQERNLARESVKETVKEVKKDVRNEVQVEKAEIKCILAGESYNVLSTVELLPNVGCHLGKNEKGYTVLGYVGDKLCSLKQYEELKSEKIQARKNEELADGSLRYIIRIGTVKFIVNVKSDSVEYVMDLC